METIVRIFCSQVFWAALAAVAGVFAAVYIRRGWRATERTWKVAKDTASYQIMLEFMREYGGGDMGRAVRELHEFYRAHKGGTDDMVEGFVRFLAGSPGEKEPAIDRERRIVSSFYQRLACMYVNGVLPKPLLLHYWEAGDLAPIIDIVLALDTRAKPRAMGGTEIPKEHWPRAFQNMAQLRDDMRTLEV